MSGMIGSRQGWLEAPYAACPVTVSDLARAVMPFIGFPKTTIVGPVWLKLMTPEGRNLRDALEALMDYEFDSLLGAHGSFLASGAKSNLRKAIDRAFPN